MTDMYNLIIKNIRGEVVYETGFVIPEAMVSTFNKILTECISGGCDWDWSGNYVK